MPDYRAIARQKARQYGIPEDIFLRQIDAESHFDPNARSSAGAEGIAQFIPSTARQYNVNAFDPLNSLDGAARYDRDLLHRYGTIDRALSAYNSGKPDAYLDPHFADGQTYNYVRSILGGKTPAPTPAAPTPTPTSTAPTSSGSPLDSLLLQMFSRNSETVGVPSLAPLLALALGSHTPTAAGDPVAATQTAGVPQSGGGRHVAPVAGNYKFGRIDQGVDVSQTAPYVSPGAGTVVRIGKVAGGTNLGVYVKLDQPVQVNGRSYPGIYVWHTSPLVKPGQRVSAGQPIMSAGSAEVGFATVDGRPAAPLVGGLGAGTQPTSPGHDMLTFFKSTHRR